MATAQMPDPAPMDDLAREAELIVRALGERASARAQRRMADQAMVDRVAGRVDGDAGTTAGAGRRAEVADRRADRDDHEADRHDRLADHLCARGIDPELAQTRVRADRSFAGPATGIGRSRSFRTTARKPVGPARTVRARTPFVARTWFAARAAGRGLR